jgi:flavin reductase (DIM6/NTAB) family NADH-FMN oxidoreductase RutF
MAVDEQALRETMRLWTCGVTVVTTSDGQRRAGMTVSSFTSISLEPPLILVCMHKEAETTQLIAHSGVFAVSLLGEEHETASMQFAGLTDLPAGADRFYKVATTTQQTGSPVLKGAIAWLDCRVYGVHDGGTHSIYVGEVLATGREADPAWPLVWHNRAYRRFVKDAQS